MRRLAGVGGRRSERVPHSRCRPCRLAAGGAERYRVPCSVGRFHLDRCSRSLSRRSFNDSLAHHSILPVDYVAETHVPHRSASVESHTSGPSGRGSRTRSRPKEAGRNGGSKPTTGEPMKEIGSPEPLGFRGLTAVARCLVYSSAALAVHLAERREGSPQLRRVNPTRTKPRRPRCGLWTALRSVSPGAFAPLPGWARLLRAHLP